MDQMPSLEIYLDILFILNFIMDYFIFWTVSKITYQKVSWKRLVLASLVAAALYCLVVVTPFLRNVHIIIYLLILPLLPLKIIFNPKNLKQWLETFVIANITALVIGGMTYGVFYWIQQQNMIAFYKSTYENFSIKVLIISTISSYLLIQGYRYYMQKRNTGIQKLYLINILHNGQKAAIYTMLDTGNKVYDPITKDPVIIIEYKKLKQLLPEGVKNFYEQNKQDVFQLVEEASHYDFGARIRLIPYSSLGNPNGMLLGFKADAVFIEEKGSNNGPIENVIIAIYAHNLSTEDTYHGLLHGDLIH